MVVSMRDYYCFSAGPIFGFIIGTLSACNAQDLAVERIDPIVETSTLNRDVETALSEPAIEDVSVDHDESIVTLPSIRVEAEPLDDQDINSEAE